MESLFNLPIELFEHIILLSDNSNTVKNFRKYFSEYTYNKVLNINFPGNELSNIIEIIYNTDIQRLEYNKEYLLKYYKYQLIDIIIVNGITIQQKKILIYWCKNNGFILSKLSIIYLLNSKYNSDYNEYILLLELLNSIYCEYFKLTLNIQISLALIYNDINYFNLLIKNYIIDDELKQYIYDYLLESSLENKVRYYITLKEIYN